MSTPGKYDSIVAPKPKTPARPAGARVVEADGAQPPVAKTPARRGRKPGLVTPMSRDTSRYRSLTLYVDVEVHQLVKMQLLAERLTFSEVVNNLLIRWLAETPQRARRPAPKLPTTTTPDRA